MNFTRVLYTLVGLFLSSVVHATEYSQWFTRNGGARSRNEQQAVNLAHQQARQRAMDACLNNSWDDYDIRHRSCTTSKDTESEFQSVPITRRNPTGLVLVWGIPIFAVNCDVWARCQRN